MLNCKDCLYKKDVPGSAHISCSRKEVKLRDVSEHGVKNGWFAFPYNFDPCWAEGCSGFTPRKYLKTDNNLEIYVQMKIENEQIEANKKGSWIEVSPKTYSDLYEAYSNLEGFDIKKISESDFDKLRKVLSQLMR